MGIYLLPILILKMKIGKGLYKFSRKIHKYPGLILILFLSWMSISGIFLNHPVLLRNFSVPGWLVPKHYHPDNWNRSTLKNLISIDSLTLIAYGNQGIHASNDKGNLFHPFMKGDFPKAAWKKRTNHLIYNSTSNQLIAATNGGIFRCPIKSGFWEKINLPENSGPVKKILLIRDKYVVVTTSALFISNNSTATSFIKKIPLKEQSSEKVPLFRVFLKLHDGSIWGLPGKIIWDLTGLVLFFLSVSAFYIWFYPKKWKKNYSKKQLKPAIKEKNTRSFLFKYHKKLGWYFAIILVAIFITGIFLRPPLLITIANKKIDKKYYPELKHQNPWRNKINNALYDSQNGQIVLECADGLWAGNSSAEDSFKKLKFPLRIFAMGATVFEENNPGEWIIGSFSGLHHFSLTDSVKTPILKQKTPETRGRPTSTLVTGYIQLPDSTEFVLGHYKGLCNLKGNVVSSKINMPQYIQQNYRMPLWNYLFELHNARIFKGIIGNFYIMIIPLFGLTGLLIIFSGVFDYWYVKLFKNKK